MSLLNVGARALLANQVALQTTGHNIANVNTAGYSRQSVGLKTVAGQNMGNGYIGNGMDVATIVRNYNDLLSRQSATASAISAGDSARSQSLSQMQEIFSGGTSGLGAAISDTMNSFADIVSAPTDLTARNVVLTRMSELAGRFRAASAQIDELDYSTRQQMGNDVNVVNSLAGQIATLNEQISKSINSGHTPNDLLDQRDQLVRDLNKYVQTSQIQADDGTLTLFVGGSQPLVMGTEAGKLELKEATQYPGSGKMTLYFKQTGGQNVEFTPSMLGGGEISGLLQFQNSDLPEGRNLLGRMAASLSMALNAQHQSGLTLDGTRGSALFTSPTSVNGSTTIPSITATAQFVDQSSASNPKPAYDYTAYAASDYKVVFGDSGALTLVRLSDNKTTAFADVTALRNTTVDGLRFDISAAGAKNESVLFQPFAAAAGNLKALVSAPRDLAVANPITAGMSQSNKGNLQLGALKMQSPNATLPPTPAGVQLSFQVDASGNVTYTVAGAASGNGSGNAYVSGQPITIDGWSITLTGTPHDGDSLLVGNALDPQYGDNYKRNAGNGTAFMDLRDKTLFDGGTSLSDGFSNIIAQIGARTQSASYAAKLSGTIATNLEADRTAVSGVNLDEEAAKLLQYQQAYQASAKMLQIAQSIFDSVLQTVAR
ncbi:flagellar hook-associated protein FlgK [Delftia sp. PS-11]|uniref:flagellar hook-associated protein FlgK n=1 Tax=Delftia sp. PS-11 TaxID=2767222 RepID=UPI002455AB1D|nr:flagellar hook-associated protein FlgK [Delftia sp. PS-11]KAJ8746248.1 flagellar hook-associated protein FlgK [Delftia sp. PS-11]